MELLTQKGVSAMGAPVIQVGGEWDIQQGNGFRVHVNNQSAGRTTISFMLSAHIPVEACGARMPEVSSSAITRSTPLRAR